MTAPVVSGKINNRDKIAIKILRIIVNHLKERTDYLMMPYLVFIDVNVWKYFSAMTQLKLDKLPHKEAEKSLQKIAGGFRQLQRTTNGVETS